MDVKAYLGDGVYVAVDPRGEFVLTTEDGIRATNTIYLEREVVDALLLFVSHARERSAKEVSHRG